MEFPKYPKIETLFERDPQTFKVVPGQFRRPEFRSVSGWCVTEKVDGTNVRVMFERTPDQTRVHLGGRTDNAQMPTFLLDYLMLAFPRSAFEQAFDADVERVVLFGEGYGPRIQKGGGSYRSTVGFRLFDVLVGDLWLTTESVSDVAKKFGVPSVPIIGYLTTETAVELARTGYGSIVAEQDGGPGRQIEGIVARSCPLMLDRLGRRIVWKLKAKDFA